MTIKTFDRSNLKTLTAEIDAALAAVAEKNGLTSLKCGNVSFTAGTFTVKVEGKTSVGDDQEKAIFESLARSYGLDPSILSFDGFNLVGYDAKRRAKPWMIRKPSDPVEKVYIINNEAARARFTPKAS